MRPLVIYGSGGHAREMREVIAALVADGADWDLLGWASDDASAHDTSLDNLPVRGWTSWATHRPHVLVAIGSPLARRRIARRIRSEVASFPAMVHPTCLIGRRVTVGEGLQAAAYAQVTVDARLGDFVLLNRGANVSHDDSVGDFVTLNPLVSLSGNVHVREGTEFGTGALVIPGIRIGAWASVGAGAVLTRDMPDNATIVGVPARVVKTKAPGWQDAPR